MLESIKKQFTDYWVDADSVNTYNALLLEYYVYLMVWVNQTNFLSTF